jgi:hypothetical protein
VTDAKQKNTLLFHCGGIQMQDIYLTFPEAAEPEKTETV